MLFDEGPTACPFVALETDRDRRAAEPDPRHRCYAEPLPAPRALAHQREFCLSPGFNGCPIFQDWAIRAAARPVPLRPPPPAEQQPEEPSGPEQLNVFAPGLPAPPAPPPAPADEPEPPAFLTGGRPAGPAQPPRAQQPGQPERIERIPSLPPPLDPPPADLEEEREPAADLPVAADEPAPPSERRRWIEDWPPAASAPAGPPATPPASPPPRVDYAQRHEAAPRQQARPSSRDDWAAQRADLIPSWERERYAAYPTIRTRLGMGDTDRLLSRLTRWFGIAAVIALLAALVLLAPNLLGGLLIPGPSPTPTVAPTPVSSPTPLATPLSLIHI